MNKIIKYLFHPLFIYLIISVLSCLPNEPKIKVYHEMPLKGENFKNVSNASVYYYDGKGKYSYASIKCFYSYDNPDFSTTYEFGGIKCIDDELNETIPLLGKMCDSSNAITVEENTKVKLPIKAYLDKSILLDKFSDIAHLLCYTLLAISLMYYFYSNEKKYIFSFVACLLGGIVLEFVQENFIPGRHSSWEDVALNSLGSILGIVCFYLLNKLIRKNLFV